MVLTVVNSNIVVTVNGKITAGNLTFNSSGLATGGFVPYDPPVACGHRRGGPRSKITCEVPKDYPHDLHSGRNRRGAWFFWQERVYE